ncbi:uncharacterized protein ACRADG_006992 [Cochliomyia hominivorax]
MPPKNGNKFKKTKIPPEKEYPLLTLEEMKIREQKYNNKLMELTKCLKFIDDALQTISKLNDEQLLQDKWLDFVTCNPLPKPYIPPDIRLFYSKMKFLENESKDMTINWLLMVNERSVLTQDIYRKDLTYRKLNENIKANIGQEYNGYIKDSLNIIHRIEYFLDNDVEVAKCPINILRDIVDRKLFIQQEIMDLIDRYTYRVISSENSEMKSIDAITAEYSFKADNYQIHIWCIKNVAIRIPYLSEPRLLANFHTIKLLLHVPSTMLRENLVIRALHLDFDHLSENDKSLKQNIRFSKENLNAGIQDLYECLVQEWIMQIEIQDKKRNEMLKKHLEYEEKLQLYEKEMENKKSRKKDDETKKSKIKIEKPTKEPPNLGNDMLPDTYEDFLKEEQQQYEHFMETVYKPELLNLSEDEINLKKYFILGGIYQLHYIEKPIHYDFNTFNMTWHKNDSMLNVDKIVNVPDAVLNKMSKKPEIDTGRRLTKLKSNFEQQNMNKDTDIECPWFILTIDFPEYLCYWDEPIVCHFETFTETKPNKEKEQLPVSENKVIIEKLQVEPHTNGNELVQPDLKETIKEPSLIPRLTETKSFILKMKRLSHEQRKSQISLANALLQKGENVEYGANTLTINDFSLTSTLTKLQIRNMERHIIPRIISSYKFPKEIRLEEMEVSMKKPKGKGGKIIRKKQSETHQQLSNRQFTYNTDMQNEPERFFAFYPKVQPLEIMSYLKDMQLPDEQTEPETFGQLIQIVSNIKKKYRLTPKQILQLKAFELQIQTHNKLIKEMLRKRKLSLMSNSLGRLSVVSSRRSSKRLSRKSDKTDRKSKLSRTNIERNTKYSFEENLLPKEESSEILDTVVKDKEPSTYISHHWTTKYIIKSEFDREKRKIVIHTNRLGNFGFAFKRYEHFPFKYWSMEPNPNDPDNEVIFTLDTQYVRCVLYITAYGIRGHVTEATKTYVRNPKMYLIIDKPMNDYKEFKKLFKSNHLNIFADCDASFYIENGYFSEKHLSNELHTYSCMSLHGTQTKFHFSQWNRLAKRRDIILYFQHYQDTIENMVQVRLTPGEAYFVEIQELCTEDLNNIELDYILTWRNIESYSDLHHLIVAMHPAATDLRCKNPKLICFIRDLLSEIRPLSFS